MAPPFVNEQTPLADEQRDALESMLERGHMTGVATVYWALIDAMGGGAPTKDQVAKWMRARRLKMIRRRCDREEAVGGCSSCRLGVIAASYDPGG